MAPISRRTLLRSAAVTAVAAPIAPLALWAGRASGETTAPAGAAAVAGAVTAVGGGLPLTVVNNTGAFTDDRIWVHIVGTDLNTGQQIHVTADGTPAPVQPSDNTADGHAAYGFRLSQQRAFSLPAMSGRVYVSTDQQIPFKVVGTPNGSGLQYPAGWVSGDPSFGIMHDCMEFTHNAGGMFCNTTNVDMFSIPMALSLAGGAGTQTTGGLRPGARADVFAQLRAQPGFGSLVIGDNLRAIAPGHGIDAGLFSPTYYDGYVAATWSARTGTPVTVAYGATTATCQVDPGTGKLNVSTGGRVVSSIAAPSTRDVFYCDGALAAPNDGVTGPVAAVLGAALNRSTLLSTSAQPTTDPATFYQDPTTNHYARILHAAAADGKAYGFAFDDVASFASYIQDTAPSSATLTLTPF